MEEFFNFLKQTRPEIGFTDVYDLSEIYQSDERYALSNIYLDPDGLDQIFGLANAGVVKEDIRTIGGLEDSVIHSLTIADRTRDGVSFNLSQQLTTDKALGEPGKQSFINNNFSDNIIIFQGGIAANNIQYNFLDANGDLRTTTVPTSRESLFNSQKDADGKFTSASYPGLFRIRRRSHFNTLNLSSKLLIPVDSIIESPTNTLNIPIYMRSDLNTSPSVISLKSYATKNSPLILRVRIFNSANFLISRDPASVNSAFVFGYELKRRSDLQLVKLETITDSNGASEVSRTINVAGTVGNNVDCLLYIYLDPSQVTKLDISGMGIVEDAGKDIGLVGFDNLEDLDISGNRLSTLPVWVKTLDSSLNRLDISGNSFWNNGIVQWFDYQDMSGGESVPTQTLLQIMTYSGYTDSGAITAYDGSYATAQDSSGNTYKDFRRTGNGTIDNANGFRIFTELETLNMGANIRVKNADFSKVFPNLKSVIMNDGDDKNLYSGYIPKLNNNGGLINISYNSQFNMTGGINYIGDNLEWDDSETTSVKNQFIGQFKITSWNTYGCRLTGGVLTESSDVSGVAKYYHVANGSNVTDAWSGWLEYLQSFNCYYEGDIAFKLASGSSAEWKNLKTININHNSRKTPVTKLKYNIAVTGTGNETAVDIVNAPKMTSINAYYGGWGGKLFSIALAPAITSMNLGANNWEGYVDSKGIQRILPDNFASSEKDSGLRKLYLHDLSSSKKLEFRENDFENIPKLYYFYVRKSYFRGKLPSIEDNSFTSGVNNMEFRIDSNRFRDISSLGTSKRIRLIYSPNQGTGMGGCLIPNYNLTGGNGILYYIHHGGSLKHTYPSNWHSSSKRNKPISPIFLGTEEKEVLTGVTWTTDSNESDKLNVASGSPNLLANILVGDEIYNGSTSLNARVTQVDFENKFIYVSSSSLNLSGVTLSFKRSGQDISSFFENYTNLRYLYLDNNRISGEIPSFTGCTKLQNIYLHRNLLTTYNKGTLQNVTGAGSSNSTPRLRRLYLYRNPLSKGSVRAIIEDAYDCAKYFAGKNLSFNVTINLKNTKYDSTSGTYINYTSSEIFDQSSTVTDPGTEETITIEDPLLVKYNQMGPGNIYSGVKFSIF
jgi:Leucine-rich repeat (LRR) protein